VSKIYFRAKSAILGMIMAKKGTLKKEESIIPQARLLRLFDIIALLKNSHCTINDLAGRIDTSGRTIYRYLRLLEEVNFLVEKDFANRYFIVTSEDEPGRSLFTIEEMKLIKKLIQSEVGGNPMRGALLKKLSLNSELDAIPRLYLKVRLGRLVDLLAAAMRDKKQVVLKNYHSANSNEIRDRLVEPFQFGDNYQSIFCLDAQDKICKQFKLDRIGDVIEMKTDFAHEILHEKKQADIFGFAGDASIWVTLNLTMRAYLLLREEFPLAISFIEKQEIDYQFHGPVTNFDGIGRFVLGLIDEVKIVKPKEFQEFVQSKIKAQTGLTG
jgi:proteasome accessory factor C